jgi:molybdopterin/thiamine biosynthesis adenylyltransferase
MGTARIGSVLKLLAARGFTATAHRNGRRAFEGHLPCTRRQLKVRLEIEDWDFQSYPQITLLDRLTEVPTLLPHLNAQGLLCYFSPGSVILDRYDPATAVAQCLEQAQAVLDKIISDPKYRAQDIQSEFSAYWASADPAALQVFMGNIAPGATSARYFLPESERRHTAIIADRTDDVNALSASFGLKPLTGGACKCWLLETTSLPPVPLHLPQTVGQVFAWLRDWDAKLNKEFQRILGREPSYLQFGYVTFAVRSPIGWIGFGFEVKNGRAKTSPPNPAAHKHFLHTAGTNLPILRLSITDISSDFVHSRNLTFPDLRGRRITLVGCGAIGSQLAPALVRLGAGTGGGILTLIDQDVLQAENLGRHYLGYGSLFEAKANAMRGELIRQFPLVRIEALAKDVARYPSLFASDLIVDATGEEAVSEMLNEHRLAKGSATPLLHVWIKGNGECVQALWTDQSGLACFRCLKISDEASHRKDRFPVLTGEPERRFLGCRAFTPYSVSAPMNAATLAADMIIDWIKGNPSPRFRTRKIENADLLAVANHDPEHDVNCPACASP